MKTSIFTNIRPFGSLALPKGSAEPGQENVRITTPLCPAHPTASFAGFNGWVGQRGFYYIIMPRKAHTPLLSPTDYNDRLHYCPETGLFTRLNVNLRFPQVVPPCKPRGYVEFLIKGTVWKGHRVAWLLYYGTDPGHFQVDHINGLRHDNRISNLRLCTNQENRCNTKRYSSNTSGVKGCCWDKKKSKWQVQIQSFGKRKHVGYFDNLEDAEHAAINARKNHHQKFACHK